MSNGFSIILGSIIIAAGIAVAGSTTETTKRYYAHQDMSACWDSGLTSGLNNLAAEVSSDQLKNSFPAFMPQAVQDSVASSYTVTLDQYAFTGMSGDGGTIKCNAGFSFKYTRPDGSVYSKTDDTIATYTVHPVSDGFDSEMNGADVPPGEVTYVPSQGENYPPPNNNSN